jgi:DNA polymerase III epsilon subunit-like protein
MKFLFVDTETTGLSAKPGMHEIVQLAGIITENRSILESVSITSKPTNWTKISQQALDVTHLTVDMLRGYTEPSIAFEIFYNAIKPHTNPRDKIKIAGQNVKFDIRFMESWWDRWKSDDVPEFSNVFDVTNPYDLMEITKPLKDLGILVVENVKLGTVATALAIQPNGALHDAMTDIDLTYRTMFDLIDRINWLNNEDISKKFEKFMNLV